MAACFRRRAIWFSRERRLEISKLIARILGEKVWSIAAQTGVMAGPIAYEVNGEQYIAVLAGWGGVFPLATGEVALKAGPIRNVSRMLAFKIGGAASLPPLPEIEKPRFASASRDGECGGGGAGRRKISALLRDVPWRRGCERRSVAGFALLEHALGRSLVSDCAWRIVEGPRNGFFREGISRHDAEAIRAYVIARANQSLAAEPVQPRK